MKDITRVLAIVVFVAMLMVPAEWFVGLKDELVLLTVGTLTILILVLWDVPTGFFLALAVLVGMYRVHVNQLNVFGWISSTRDHGYTVRSKSLFTTEEHLERAQTNVVDKKNYEQEMIGIKGVYGEPVYGAQGIAATDYALPGVEAGTFAPNYPLA